MTKHNHSRALTALSGAVVALMASGCSAAIRTTASSGDEFMTTQSPPGRHHRDGTYTATGLYGGLPSKLTVTATLAGDRLIDVSVKTHATDPTSLDYQRRFAAAVPEVVKGKRLDEVKVGKLAGASGCPDGFNAAIERIRTEARQS